MPASSFGARPNERYDYKHDHSGRAPHVPIDARCNQAGSRGLGEIRNGRPSLYMSLRLSFRIKKNVQFDWSWAVGLCFFGHVAVIQSGVTIHSQRIEIVGPLLHDLPAFGQMLSLVVDT